MPPPDTPERIAEKPLPTPPPPEPKKSLAPRCRRPPEPSKCAVFRNAARLARLKSPVTILLQICYNSRAETTENHEKPNKTTRGTFEAGLRLKKENQSKFKMLANGRNA